MSILFLGSGPFGVPTLERLATLAPSPLAVGTVPDAPRGRARRPVPTPVKEKAEELGLPCHEVSTLKKEHGASLLRESAADLVIVADFRLMLPVRFLAAPARGCYNLHGSLLPAHRGAAPIAHGVLQGDRTFGVTLYRMVKALDAGPIVGARELQPEGKPDAATLEARLSHLAADLLEEWLPILEEGDVPLRPQDEAAATFAPKLSKEDGWIRWEHRAAAIENRVLAMTPWPRTFSRWFPARGEDFLVFLDQVAAVPEPDHGEAPCGMILASEPDAITVACGPGGTEAVSISRLQRAGKRSLPAAEFLRGVTVEGGERFASPAVENASGPEGGERP